MDKDILKRKIHLQKVRNCLTCLKGVDIVRLLENTEHQKLFAVEQKYFPYIYSIDKTPDAILSCHSSEKELIEWIKLQTGIQSNKNYYFRCFGVWVEIQIAEAEIGIKSLWEHAQYLGHQHSYGFILVDEQIEKMVEVGFDSRDEYNYFYDSYPLLTV